MSRLAYRLVPASGGFHLGREGLAQETSADVFPSDSLFSALIAVIAQLEPDAVATRIDQMTAGLRLSSVYPYVGDLPLFPFPRLRVNLEQYDPRYGKMLKKIRFVSPAILNRLLNAQPMDSWLPLDSVRDGLLLNGGRVWIATAEQDVLPGDLRQLNMDTLAEESFWTTGTVPRVTIDRVTNASNIYQVGRTVFREGCGLWLLADIDSDLMPFLEKVLHLLGDSGIGGDRSSGYGAFTPEPMAPPDLPDATAGVRALTLSRYHPTLDELRASVLGADAAYDLVDVGGWMGFPGRASQRRQRVRMIEAGSVVNVRDGLPHGDMPDVRPVDGEYTFEHPIYRSGLALLVGIPGEMDT